MKRAENTLLFLTLLFLPTQLGRHFWPDFSYVFSLPIDYLSPTIFFWDLLTVLLLAVFIFQKKTVNRMALNLYLFFIFTCVLSLLPVGGRVVSFGAGLVRLEQYLIAGLFGVYLASIEIKKYKSLIFISLAISVVFESFLAMGQFLSGQTLGFWILGERTFSLSTPGIAKFDFQGVEVLRPYATFPHPNVLAGFMILITIILYTLNRSIKITGAMALLGGLTIMLTVSRAALIAGLLAFIFLSKNKGRVIIVVVLLIFLPVLYTRFLSLLDFDNLTVLRREELGVVALKIFRNNPVFGAGVNNFIPAASNELLVGPSRFLQPVHNIFLLQLAETGILGLAGLLLLIWIPLRKNKAMTGIWAVIIFLGMFDHYFLTLPQGYRMLFLVWGLGLQLKHG